MKTIVGIKPAPARGSLRGELACFATLCGEVLAQNIADASFRVHRWATRHMYNMRRINDGVRYAMDSTYPMKGLTASEIATQRV